MKSRSENWIPGFLTAGMVLLLVAVTFGVKSTLESQAFFVKNIEVESNLKRSPLSQEEIVASTGIRVGEVPLYDVSIESVKERLATLDWFENIKIQKVFPSTLKIELSYYQPIAIFKSDANTELQYLSGSGKIFGELRSLFSLDLPILSLRQTGDAEATVLSEASEWIAAWNRTLGTLDYSLSEIRYSPDCGFTSFFSLFSVKSGKSFRGSVDLGDIHEAEGVEGKETVLGTMPYIVEELMKKQVFSAHFSPVGPLKWIVKKLSTTEKTQSLPVH
jgi:hypothetical protein